MEEEVGGDDEEAAEEELGGEGFIGVMNCGEAGDPGGEEEGEEAREDGFGAVDDGGFGGGNVGLPFVHLDEGNDGAEENEGQGNDDDRRVAVAGDDIARAPPGGRGDGCRDDGHGEEHHEREIERIIAGEFRTFEPEDLTGEENRAKQSFRFAAAELKGTRVEI